MTKKNISAKSLEWLDYMTNDKRFINSKNEVCNIQTGWNYGEKKIGEYFLDGYVVNDGKHFALEFLGCRYHNCEDCNISIGDETVSF